MAFENNQTTVGKKPELDRVQGELLYALKEETPGKKTAVAVLKAGLDGLHEDLLELGIPESQWKKYDDIFTEKFQEATKEIQGEAISKSLEGAHLGVFVGSFEKAAGLDTVIAEKAKDKPKTATTPIQKFLEANPKVAKSIGAALLAWLGFDKKEKSDTPKPEDAVMAQKTPEEQQEEDELDAETRAGQQVEEEEATTRKAEGGTGAGWGGGGGKSPSGSPESVRMGTGKYNLDDPRYLEKLSPGEFKKVYEGTTNRQAAYGLVLKQVAAGNAEITFKDMKVAADDGTEMTMRVATRELKVAGMSVHLDGPTALAAMKILGCTLPTDWVTERRWEQAKAEGGQIPFIAAPDVAKALGIPWDPDHPNGPIMMSTAFASKRSEMVDKWRKDHGMTGEKTEDGNIKHIVHPIDGVTGIGHLAFIGGRDSKGNKVQGKGTSQLEGEGYHEEGYGDYSHGVVAVENKGNSVTVKERQADGSIVAKTMSAEDFYANPEYAKKFGFRVVPKGRSYSSTPELDAFVDKNKPKSESTPAGTPEAPKSPTEGTMASVTPPATPNQSISKAA